MRGKSESDVNRAGNSSFIFFCSYARMQTVDKQAQIRSFIQDLTNQVAMADGLLRDGTRVDLAGFDAQVGLLCAQALDLPPDQGRALAPELIQLRDRVERLTARFTAPVAAEPLAADRRDA